MLALADLSIRFAVSLDDEAEHWLRVMRLHGEVGHALQALGVPEAPRARASTSQAGEAPEVRRPGKLGSVELVARRALEEGRRRRTPLVQTADVLAAVLSIYGQTFDRVLDEHDTSREELLDRLAARSSRPASDRSPPSRSAAIRRPPTAPARARPRAGRRRSTGGPRRR